jgi:hypothetical protein
MKDLYALAYFDKETGEFVEYIRKGRNYSISGYDNISGARRGLSQSKRSYRASIYDLRIVKATDVEIVEPIE